MKLSNRKFYFKVAWVFSILVVFAIGVCCFPREYEKLTLLESVYYTIRLFILEHDVPHFPRSWPLRAIYFIAPMVTFSALWYVVKYLFHLAPRIKSMWASDHVVVCGVGGTGKLIASTLTERGVKVVGIDLGPDAAFEEWLSLHKIPMLFGDFHSARLLSRAGADRARAIVFAAGDDLANLEGAMAAYSAFGGKDGPIRLIWTHVANERLADTARKAVRTEGTLGIRFFDTYRIAASKMIEKHFNAEVRAGVRMVTLIGFGKFGRDLLEILVRDLNGGDNFAIKVIDKRDLGGQIDAMAGDLGVRDRVSFERADIHDLQLEDELDEAFFVCTDDDLGNLTAAMMLASKVVCTHIYVRMATWPLSAVAEHLGEDRGVTFVNINDLVVKGLDELAGIFKPAEKKDLKRAKL